jgi:hypothetical protein
MREIVIKSITADDMPAIRHLQAAEGYLDLGMFTEAEVELHDLDPDWFAFEQVLLLQSRVHAGLNQGNKTY